ncbi:MAG TPA: hypothetical protein VMT75_06875 [Candidatus Saccharimonadales bacterium]|nr:hypothetical protein [Candidatus Saccharimonadales bacterium]
MNKRFAIAGLSGLALLALSGLNAPRAAAQDPIVAPIIAAEAAPIVAKVLTPKPKDTGTEKFEGYVMNANLAQITVRAKGNDLGIQTFALNQDVSAKMQKIIDKGGYQYGDKVTIYYDPQSKQAVKIKGKPSKAL